MHRLLSIVLPCMFALTLIGCEEVVNVDLPYDKRIVVNAFLGRGSDTIVWLSQTLPVDAAVSVESASLRNATVTIEVDGQVVQCPPVDTLPGGYALPRLTSWAGKSATLRVKAQGMDAVARTTVPPMPEIIRLQARRAEQPDDWEPGGGRMYVVEAIVRMYQPGVVWVQNDDFGRFEPYDIVPMEFWTPYNAVRRGDTTNLEQVAVPLFSTYVNDNDPYSRLPETLRVRLNHADENFIRFLDRPRGGSNDGFGFGGANPYFNVTGQGIGLFVGVAQTPAVTLPVVRME